MLEKATNGKAMLVLESDFEENASIIESNVLNLRAAAESTDMLL